MHGDVWFDLEGVYTRPRDLEAFVMELSRLMATYDIDAVCGALVGGAFIGYSIALKLGVGFLFTERFESRLPGNEMKVDYRLPKTLQPVVAGKRVAIVDDVINAGSAVLKTHSQLVRHAARPVVLASLLTVGGKPPKVLPGNEVPIVTLDHLESNLWGPKDCPLCRSGVPLADPYAPVPSEG